MYDMDSDSSACFGGNKRPAAPTGPESTKKRAPYASRACDACRRRKGRCSGESPCTYCVSRSLECGGMGEQQATGFQANLTPPPSVTSRDSRTTTAPLPPNRGQFQSFSGEETQYGANADIRMLSSLGDLVASLQKEVGTLTSKMKTMERNTPSHHADDYSDLHNAGSSACGSEVYPSDKQASPRQQLHKRAAHRRRFCGPTSPDYSLNMAQMHMQQGDSSHRFTRPRLPSMDDTQSDDGDSSDGLDDGDEPSSARISGRALEKLTGFRRLLSKQESVRLVYTYQAVFGDFHPIVDMEAMVRQIDAWYEPNKPAADESLLLITNLVLAIALCAEPTSEVDVAKAIYTYCRESIGKKIVCPAPNVTNATILLLVGTYHFFKDDARFAWRMVGAAGNMLLELGLHSRDASEHMISSDNERAQVIAVICTTIVLDRQWSAATGLPTHFQESHFHHAMKSSEVESPYLKAMVAFMAVSDKYTSPIARITNTDKPYEEDDTFEILNFQIEQWRKNAVGSYNFTLHGTWRTTPISRVPSWAVLLNLRANAAHSMLLRPFFFTSKLTAASKKNIEPAVHLFSDTINILSNLDKSTEVYRKQQPFYIHLLVSACALMSLVIAHVAQHHAALAADLPEDFSQTLSRSFRKAFNLSETYNTTSRASRKLWKRLLLMREPLIQLNILPREGQQSNKMPSQLGQRQQQDLVSQAQLEMGQTRYGRGSGSGASQPRRDQASSMAMSQATMKGVSEGRSIGNNDGALYQHAANNEFMPDLSAPPVNMDLNMAALDGIGVMNNMAAFGGPSSIFHDWPLVDGQTFFSEGELLYEE